MWLSPKCNHMYPYIKGKFDYPQEKGRPSDGKRGKQSHRKTCYTADFKEEGAMSQ